MVYGNFGNPMNCTNEGRFFNQKTHPQYSEIYSTILAAFTTKKRIKLYAHSRKSVGTLNLSLHITQLLQMERCISLIRAYL